MTLVSGNARLSIFGLAGGACFGAFGGLVIKLTELPRPGRCGSR